MKTVGQILKAERTKRGISVEHLSTLTKIDAKYIDALEADRYNLLPSETFIKGFIRNLSLRLDRDPSDWIAIFRRDFRHPHKQKSDNHPHKKNYFATRFLSSQFLPFILGGFVFLIYLGFQFRVILTPPKLRISAPINNSILVSPIEIVGQTEIAARVTINGDTEAKPDSEGNFSVRLNLPVGETEIEIKTLNRFGRNTIKKIPLTIISK